MRGDGQKHARATNQRGEKCWSRSRCYGTVCLWLVNIRIQHHWKAQMTVLHTLQLHYRLNPSPLQQLFVERTYSCTIAQHHTPPSIDTGKVRHCQRLSQLAVPLSTFVKHLPFQFPRLDRPPPQDSKSFVQRQNESSYSFAQNRNSRRYPR